MVNHTGRALRSSAFFGEGSISTLGGPQLWTIPGEVDIYGISVAKKDAKERTVPPAFSELSLMAMHKEGQIDMEGIQMLRKISKDAEKIQVYDSCLPTLLVRNPSLSTSVSLPSLDALRKTEILFGSQKVIYLYCRVSKFLLRFFCCCCSRICIRMLKK